jgi:transposase
MRALYPEVVDAIWAVKLAWKWSVRADINGIPIGWTTDGAKRNDSILLAPTLDDAAGRGLLAEIDTLWLDRGYDSDATRQRLAARAIDDAVIANKRKRGSSETKNKNQPMGLRWPVERSNSWLSNYSTALATVDRVINEYAEEARLGSAA